MLINQQTFYKGFKKYDDNIDVKLILGFTNNFWRKRMKILRRTKVKVKITIAFLIIVLIIGIVGAMGMNSLRKSNSNAEDMYNNSLKNLYMLSDTEQNLSAINIYQK